ncbi:MAG: hypothetical protein ACLPQS_03835 [Acidimicrobiales bacterium]
MASPPRAAWRRIKMSLASQVAAEVAPTLDEQRARLEAVEAQLAALTEQVRELHRIAGIQVDVANESTELLGRLIRSSSSRIDLLEERASREQ